MSRVNELKLTQQQYEQAITTINNQYKEVMAKIQEIQNTLESINQKILSLILSKKLTNNFRRNSTEEHPPNRPKSCPNNYYTRSPPNYNTDIQYLNYDVDSHKFLAQQSASSFQQDTFQPPDNDTTEDIKIHTVTADSETTGQPTFNISNLIPTNWDVYPRSGQ
ncbi:hypothetical protein RCL_jg9660.t1 [Rhizophagus clarus]|nr:hypothetical protein RCL_jg9660.t1 [Rhizophagus clarus]